MNVFLRIIRAKLVAVNIFIAVIVAGSVPNGVTAEFTDLGSGAVPSSILREIKMGPLPGTHSFYEKDIASASWFTKWGWAVHWAFLPKTFEAFWPLYAYKSNVLADKCGVINSNALKQYNVGRGTLISKIDQRYIGIPLKHSSNADSLKQLAKFAPVLAGSFSSKLKPGEIQFADKQWTIAGQRSAEMKSAALSSLEDAYVDRLRREGQPGEEQLRKSVGYLREALKVYADNLGDAGRDADALTLKGVCSTAELLGQNVLLATKYPVLDSKLTKRLTMGQSLTPSD